MTEKTIDFEKLKVFKEARILTTFLLIEKVH